MNQILTDEVMFALCVLALLAMCGTLVRLLRHREHWGFLALAALSVLLYLSVGGYYFSLALDPSTTPVSDIPYLALLGRPAIAGIVGMLLALWFVILWLREHLGHE